MKFLDKVREDIAQLDEERTGLIRKLEEHAEAAPAAPEDDATDEVRSAIDADQKAWIEAGDKLIADIEPLNERLTGLRTKERTLQAADDDLERTRGPQYMRRNGDATRDVDPLSLNDTEARAAAVTLAEQSKSFLSDQQRSDVTDKIERGGRSSAAIARLVLTAGSELYERAWLKYAQGMFLTAEEGEALNRGKEVFVQGEGRFGSERAGMTSGTGSSGGYQVPVVIDPTLHVTGAGSYNPIRDLATVKTIGPAFGGWYGVTAAQVTAVWTAETNAAPDNTPTLVQPNIPIYMGETFIPVSYQAYEDISDLASDVSTLFADAKTNLEAIAHQTGDGSSKPEGVVHCVAAVTASRVSPATGGTFGLVDTYTLDGSLPARWWNNTSVAWLAHKKTFNSIRTLAQQQNSANSVWTDPGPGKPSMLLGDPNYLASEMTSTQTTGTNLLLKGAFERYYIIDRIGFTVEFIPNLFDTSSGRPTAQRGWLGHWRTGAKSIDNDAFRLLQL